VKLDAQRWECHGGRRTAPGEIRFFSERWPADQQRFFAASETVMGKRPIHLMIVGRNGARRFAVTEGFEEIEDLLTEHGAPKIWLAWKAKKSSLKLEAGKSIRRMEGNTFFRNFFDGRSEKEIAYARKASSRPFPRTGTIPCNGRRFETAVHFPQRTNDFPCLVLGRIPGPRPGDSHRSLARVCCVDNEVGRGGFNLAKGEGKHQDFPGRATRLSKMMRQGKIAPTDAFASKQIGRVGRH